MNNRSDARTKAARDDEAVGITFTAAPYLGDPVLWPVDRRRSWRHTRTGASLLPALVHLRPRRVEVDSATGCQRCLWEVVLVSKRTRLPLVLAGPCPVASAAALPLALQLPDADDHGTFLAVRRHKHSPCPCKGACLVVSVTGEERFGAPPSASRGPHASSCV